MSDEFTDFVANLEPQYANAAVYMHTFNAKTHGGATLEHAHAAAVKAFYDSIYGHDAKKDRAGNFIQQGVGSPGHENGNHFAAILRYQGRESYNRAVKEIFARDPERAKKIGLEQPRVA
jgi:hypothetical protein